MTTAQIIWAALIICAAVANCPFILFLLKHWKNDMPPSPAAQAVIDSLTAANTELTTALANASASATAQGAEDVAAISTAAQPLLAAITAAAAPAPAPEGE